MSEDSMKKGPIILIALIILVGCPASRSENPQALLKRVGVGDTVYVCGCPMICCNFISGNPDGRCSCNVPLKKGTVLRIQDGQIHVRTANREKWFFIAAR